MLNAKFSKNNIFPYINNKEMKRCGQCLAKRVNDEDVGKILKRYGDTFLKEHNIYTDPKKVHLCEECLDSKLSTLMLYKMTEEKKDKYKYLPSEIDYIRNHEDRIKIMAEVIGRQQQIIDNITTALCSHLMVDELNQFLDSLGFPKKSKIEENYNDVMDDLHNATSLIRIRLNNNNNCNYGTYYNIEGNWSVILCNDATKS